jgi:DNA repair protein RadC
MVREKPALYRITDLESSERPRERLAELGAQSLSTSELLAILLRVGVAGENSVQVGQRLLKEFGGIRGLQRASFLELCKQKGVGQAKAAQVKAALELGQRLRSENADERAEIHNPKSAAELVEYEMAELPQEHLRVINLDTRNHVINIEQVYVGSVNASSVRVGELFKSAIQRNATAIILVHNHPSGDPTPSPEDVALTRAVIQAGKLLDVDVLDHLVIGRGRFVSLKERGVAFVG